MDRSCHEQIDRVVIGDVILRERAARDAGLWSDMAALYHPDSSIDISWFNGTGAQFTLATEKMSAGPLYSFQQMGAAVIAIEGDRAIADSNCTVHAFTSLGGVDVRPQWRARRSGARWLVAGLRALYIRDVLTHVNPQQVPQLEDKLLAGLRPSYRFIAHLMSKAGHVVRDDLPGVDKPETVAALRAAELQWLQ
jgi:hypothetical protein